MKMPAHIAKIPQELRNCRRCLYAERDANFNREVVFCKKQKCTVRAEGKVCFSHFTSFQAR